MSALSVFKFNDNEEEGGPVCVLLFGMEVLAFSLSSAAIMSHPSCSPMGLES